MQAIIREVLKRRKQWERLYTRSYMERFFTLSPEEIEAFCELARRTDGQKLKAEKTTKRRQSKTTVMPNNGIDDYHDIANPKEPKHHAMD